MTSDVVIATRTNDVWSHSDLVTGPTLEGFAIAAPPSGKGPPVWDRLDPNDPTSHELTVGQAP
jgi:hypothetical protein